MIEPTYRPIIFSTPMVRALLSGSKTQTRRIIKPKPDENGVAYMKNAPLDWKGEWFPWMWDNEEGERFAKHCPYGEPGDVLWVRESFGSNGLDYFRYKADWIEEDGYDKGPGFKKPWDKWKPSIHMPRKAARLFLQVTEIRVERLLSISEVDAESEGVDRVLGSNQIPGERGWKSGYINYHDPRRILDTAVLSFFSLWESIHGADSLNANPWVWVVKFKRVEK